MSVILQKMALDVISIIEFLRVRFFSHVLLDKTRKIQELTDIF